MNAKTILLVEDKRPDELLTLRSLRKVHPGGRVDVVRDGQQALDYLFGEGEFFDRPAREVPTLVLLDLNLPRLGGLEVLQRVRADVRTRLLPVVMLTSSDDERDRWRSYETGASGYVRKPLDFGAYSEAVVRLGLYWLFTNESPYS